MSAFFAAIFGVLVDAFMGIFKTNKPLETKVLDEKSIVPKKPDSVLLGELGIDPVVRVDPGADDGA